MGGGRRAGAVHRAVQTGAVSASGGDIPPAPLNRYIIALGSNRGHGNARTPRAMIMQAVATLPSCGVAITRQGPIIDTAPLGPSKRRYANSAIEVATTLAPEGLLATLQQIERRLGRRRGQRWGARSIDLDIILWSAGRWRSRTLTLPHPRWRERNFVLLPMAVIAAQWRDPVTGRTVRQLASRNRRARHIDPSARRA